jgi:hypothetical protein
MPAAGQRVELCWKMTTSSRLFEKKRLFQPMPLYPPQLPVTTT